MSQSVESEWSPDSAESARAGRSQADSGPDQSQSQTRAHQGRGHRFDHRKANQIAPRLGIEELIESAVERAVERVLGPFLHRLTSCEPQVFTIAQAAQTLQVSDDTIARMVRRGHLPRVPHVGSKVLIPRRILLELVESSGHTANDRAMLAEINSLNPRATDPSALQPPGPILG